MVPNNVYLNHLEQAFQKVASQYYSTHAAQHMEQLASNQCEIVIYEQRIERVFCYELYHQYRLVMLSNRRYYQELVLNGEITKIYPDEKHALKQRMSPDFVVHNCQMDLRPNYQTLFIEVKTSDNPEIKSDLRKLQIAVEQLNYQYAVLVAINCSLFIIEEKIREFFAALASEKTRKKIILFHRQFPADTLTKKTLNEILLIQ